jgi:hypothetical protein
MKILFYRNSYNPLFESIIYTITKTKSKFGFLSGSINKESIEKFGPDIIMHNIPDRTDFPIENNAISIAFNEIESKNSFSFNNEKSENYIKPFVSLKSSDHKEEKKYCSDIVYVGSPMIFQSILDFLVDPKNKIQFKFFSPQPHNVNGYCGVCDNREYFKYYKSSKGCIVEKKDIIRQMDIVISDGNPIIFEKNKSDEAINKIKEAVFEGKKFTIEGLSKDEIFEKHTAFDRASEIFKKIGLKKFSQEIINSKGWTE